MIGCLFFIVLGMVCGFLGSTLADVGWSLGAGQWTHAPPVVEFAGAFVMGYGLMASLQRYAKGRAR